MITEEQLFQYIDLHSLMVLTAIMNHMPLDHREEYIDMWDTYKEEAMNMFKSQYAILKPGESLEYEPCSEDTG